MARLYCGNLPWQVTEDEIIEHFSSYGISSVRLITDKETGSSKGYGFIEVALAQECIDELNGVFLKGRALTVSKAHYESQPKR